MFLKGEQGKLLLGLIGAAIQTSRIPAMHEREAAQHGIRCIYQLIDLDELNLTVAWLPELLAVVSEVCAHFRHHPSGGGRTDGVFRAEHHAPVQAKNHTILDRPF
jgi:hypothetical protein